jgi:4-amino-4-deoxy-L-arabinose transferase-like glycosyltransferase
MTSILNKKVGSTNKPMIKVFQPDQLEDQAQPVPLARRLFLNWEIYLILFLGAFLHLVNINKALFNIDEADFYGMAHDAIISGWLPLTGTRASLGNLNPPLVMYVFMLPASFSSNPLWGQVMVALFNTAAVLLTYFFVRRYYGRLAGTTAALLFTTSVGAWTFSRNIWNPNFLPFFVMLFMFVLFRGVVERRKGWLFWALLLMGIIYQFHGSSLYLLIPLAAAMFLAYKTIRVRDIALAVVALLVLLTPYIIWEFHVHFADVTILFSAAKQSAHIDTEALHFYLFFIHPTLINPYLDLFQRQRDTHLMIPNSQSILIHSHLLTLLSLAYLLSILLLIGGVLVAIGRIFSAPIASTARLQKSIFVLWWREFQAAPERQGLALLLLWQIAPLLLLTRHSVGLVVHYFIFFLPGQFILMALCCKQVITLARQFRPSWERIARYSMSVLATLLIVTQLIGIGGAIIDLTIAGNFQSSVFSDVPDQQNALQMADQIARQRQIHRIYLTAFPTYIKMNSMEYLAQQIKTPVDFFTSDDCFILPSPSAGPVIFLTTSGNSLANVFFSQYADATLVATAPHLGSTPYQIYVVTAKSEPAPVSQAFNQNLQLLSRTAQLLHGQWLTIRWSVLSAHNPAFRTTYGFNIQMHSLTGPALNDSLNCTPTLTWAGDQLFIFHTRENGSSLPQQLAIRASTFVSQPQTLSLGPVTGFTDYFETTGWQTLLTADRKPEITLPVTVS